MLSSELGVRVGGAVGVVAAPVVVAVTEVEVD